MLIVPPAALINVPLLTVSVVANDPLLVSSMDPLLVNPLTTARLVVVDASKRTIDPAVVLNAPFSVEAPEATSVPRFVTGGATVVADSVIDPSLAIDPAPVRAQLVKVATPCAPIVHGPVTIRVRLVPVNVCTPLVAPLIRTLATVSLALSVTV